MTGGEKHSWHQQQQKRVFRRGIPAAGFGLDPNLLSEIFPHLMKQYHQSSLHGFNAKQVQQLTQRLTKP